MAQRMHILNKQRFAIQEIEIKHQHELVDLRRKLSYDFMHTLDAIAKKMSISIPPKLMRAIVPKTGIRD